MATYRVILSCLVIDADSEQEALDIVSKKLESNTNIDTCPIEAERWED